MIIKDRVQYDVSPSVYDEFHSELMLIGYTEDGWVNVTSSRELFNRLFNGEFDNDDSANNAQRAKAIKTQNDMMAALTVPSEYADSAIDF